MKKIIIVVAVIFALIALLLYSLYKDDQREFSRKETDLLIICNRFFESIRENDLQRFKELINPRMKINQRDFNNLCQVITRNSNGKGGKLLYISTLNYKPAHVRCYDIMFELNNSNRTIQFFINPKSRLIENISLSSNLQEEFHDLTITHR